FVCVAEVDYEARNTGMFKTRCFPPWPLSSALFGAGLMTAPRARPQVSSRFARPSVGPCGSVGDRPQLSQTGHNIQLRNRLDGGELAKYRIGQTTTTVA